MENEGYETIDLLEVLTPSGSTCWPSFSPP